MIVSAAFSLLLLLFYLSLFKVCDILFWVAACHNDDGKIKIHNALTRVLQDLSNDPRIAPTTPIYVEQQHHHEQQRQQQLSYHPMPSPDLHSFIYQFVST